jgi:hypothetical protein
VSRRIFNSEVGFVFNNSAGKQGSSFTANEELPKQLASNGHGITVEEIAWKNLGVP